MEGYVYLVNSSTKPVMEHLENAGFQVKLGDGRYSDELLAGCWALIPGRDPVTREILDKAKKLRIICKKGVGLDRIDIPECTKRNICVANTPYSNYISVAEHTFALLMAAAKKLYPISCSVRCDAPDNKCMYKYPPVELYGKTLSIIGLGNIGMRVAKIAAGFEMRVIAYVRHPEKVQPIKGLELVNSLDEALTMGDYVSLHVSGSAENRGLIGAREFERMKKGAVLINTTRGFVVDEQALLEALLERRIAGAALDVFEKEPLEGTNPLLKLENVVATPHCGGYTVEANERGYLECAQIIIDYANKEYPKTAANQVGF